MELSAGENQNLPALHFNCPSATPIKGPEAGKRVSAWRVNQATYIDQQESGNQRNCSPYSQLRQASGRLRATLANSILLAK